MTEELKPLPCPFEEWFDEAYPDMKEGGAFFELRDTFIGVAQKAWDAALTRSPAWRDDMEAAKEYEYSRFDRGDDRLGVIVVCQWGSRWSANHAWWNDHEEEWNDISGDQIVHPVYWAPLPPKLKAGGEHDNDK